MTEEEMRKKADEFMKSLEDKSKEQENVEKTTYSALKYYENNIDPQKINSKKNEIFLRMVADAESVLDLQKKLESKEEIKQQHTKKTTNWGCLILFSFLGIVLPIGIFVNSFIESSKGNSPLMVGGFIIYLIIIFLTLFEGSKRRY